MIRPLSIRVLAGALLLESALLAAFWLSTEHLNLHDSFIAILLAAAQLPGVLVASIIPGDGSDFPHWAVVFLVQVASIYVIGAAATRSRERRNQTGSGPRA